MRIVDEAGFRRRPVGALVVGRCWLYGALEGGLRFSILCGDADEESAGALMRLWRTELEARPHPSICDAAALRSVTPQAFAVVSGFLTEQRGRLPRRLQRLALVRPGGLVGALVAGYYSVFPPPHDHRVFATRADALAWLGFPAEALAAADGHVREDPLLRALRDRLAGGAAARIERVARGLGVSPRSLQRRLRGAGTSFSRELRRAQIERAMELLRSSDQKIAAIASAVGCASLASFSEMFRREVGTPPSAWRAAHRVARGA